MAYPYSVFELVETDVASVRGVGSESAVAAEAPLHE